MRRSKVVLSTVAAAAAVVTTLAMSGCSAGGGDSGSKTLNLMLIDTDSTKELKAIYIPEFEKETGITVNVDLVPESGMDAKLSVSLGSKSGQYDVVEAGAKNLSTLVASKWLKPLDSYLDDTSKTPTSYTDGFSSQLLKTIQIDKATYTMPYQVGADLLFYNKKMFEAAGLDPADPPRTMSEIVADAKKLTKPDAGQAGFVARGTREGNDNSFSWIMQWFLNGGRWADANGKPKYDVLTDPAAIKTTEQYTQLMTKYAPAGASNYSYLEAQTAMQQGKAAMWLDAAQLGPTLEDKTKSTIAGNVGYAAPKGSGSGYIVGAIWGFSMVDTTKNPDAAWKLIQFLTDKKVAVGQAVSGTNGSPARADALADPAVRKAFNPDFLKALSTAIEQANPLYSPVIPQGTQIRGDLSLALSQVLSGQANPQEAMTTANNQIKELLK